jgi:hypothetical protein
MSMKKIWIVALGAVLLLGFATAAFAQQASPTPQVKATNGQVRKLQGDKLRKELVPLHLDGVALNRADGTLVDVRFQKGIITAVSADSITLKSPGNYVQTYKIDANTKVREKGQPSTVAELKVGEMANVRAVKSGDSYIARIIGCVGEPGPRLKALIGG